jgi:hypothetical protein
METVHVPTHKIIQVINDVEKLVSDCEGLVGKDQDNIVKQRLSDVKESKIKAKTEKELDDYLKKRGVKID